MRFGQYNVHRSFAPQDSAAIFNEMDRRINILKKHLDKKYGCVTCPKTINTNEVGKNIGYESKQTIIQFNMYERTKQLVENYNSKSLYEISPNNIMGNTSFTENKGRKIVMCLRDKTTEQVHDINTIMFVALHEITHVMNDRWGHETQFWELFRIILIESVECGIYTPVDYATYPIRYCGITVAQSPLFL